MWHAAGNGKGEKNMVVVPYKDRLEWLTRYIQQLVMESLGKGRDDSGEEVEQGVSVFGNKGSTDQHSYIQQLREGLDDFFLTFVQVLNDGRGPALNVEDGITSGDYLHSFLFGTKRAVSEMNRDVMTLTIETVSPFSIGVLIALFERAVGFYAALVNINAYHQPGVEAGKKAAANALQLQLRVLNFLKKARGMVYTVEAIAAGVEAADKMPAIHEICEHLSQNPPSGIQRIPSHTGSLFFRAV
jgi:glucose-6-phosphate isomerase